MAKKKPMFYETREIDYIKCPWCGERFDGKEATNNNQDNEYLDCPICGNRIHTMQSVEYLTYPVGEDGEDING